MAGRIYEDNIKVDFKRQCVKIVARNVVHLRPVVCLVTSRRKIY